MAKIEGNAPPPNRIPGLLAGRIVVPDDVDDFTAADAELWYGDKDDLLIIKDPFAEDDVDENDPR
jgi:hypothetical protein